MHGCLWGLLIFIVLGIVGKVVELFEGKGASSTPYTPRTPSIPPLSIRVRRSSWEIDGEEIPTFRVDMKGQLPGPIYGTAEVEFFFHLFDTKKTAEGFEPLVFSSIDLFREESSRAFQFRMEPEEMSGVNYLKRWVEVFQFPVFCLGFPWKGRRKFKLRCLAMEANQTGEQTMFEYGYPVRGSETFYEEVETTFSYEVLEPGWLDEDESRLEVWVLTIELAMHVAAADGSLDKAEGEVVKEWARQVISQEPEGRAEETKRKINAALKRSYAKASKGVISLNSVCGLLAEVATDHQKYRALKLCVEVMEADSKAEGTELKELDRIVALLGLDPKQYKKMLDQTLATIPLSPVDSAGGGKKALLGIRDGMEKGEIKEILTEEMSKWNGLTTSPDPALRARAEEMLRLIGELRMELLG